MFALSQRERKSIASKFPPTKQVTWFTVIKPINRMTLTSDTVSDGYIGNWWKMSVNTRTSTHFGRRSLAFSWRTVCTHYTAHMIV